MKLQVGKLGLEVPKLGMPYEEYQYLWPPRPEKAIARQMLSFYEKLGYFAQVKKNGTCTVIFAKGDEVIFKTRHKDDHKTWSPNQKHLDFFRGFDQWNVFVAELLHSKTPHIKNQLYIFDQVVADGRQLVDVSYIDRQRGLNRLWTGDDEFDQIRVGEYVSLAKNFASGFDALFDTLKPEDEGVVLKNPKANLNMCLTPSANAEWQVKCRIPHKNYGF